MISGAQISAGRAMLGLSQEALAAQAGVSLPTVKRIESFGDNWTGTVRINAKIRGLMEGLGMEFIDENDGLGRGIRFSVIRKYREDPELRNVSKSV